jgi:V8-like Glu-specific endopeptidase
MSSSKVWMVLAVMTAGGCVAPPDSSEATGDATQAPIVGGKEATSYSEAALVNLYQQGQWKAICSGAVIAPRVVLTAGHCIHGWDDWEVTAPYSKGGQSAKALEGVVYDYAESSDTVNPNQHDIGLVILDGVIELDAYPTLAKASLADGSAIVNVGRIQDGNASYTQLFVSAEVNVSDGASVGYPFAYTTDRVIEPGDSGGPDLLPGPAPHTIVAVNSGAGDSLQVLARVDLVYDWIQDQIAASENLPGDPPSSDPPSSDPPSSDPPNGTLCSGIDHGGLCDGDVMVHCLGGATLTEFDCGAFGLSCQMAAGSPTCG